MNLGSNGLTSEEARTRPAKFGPNAMPDTSVHPLRMAVEKFWAPTFVSAVAFAFLLDCVKVPVFRRLGIT